MSTQNQIPNHECSNCGQSFLTKDGLNGHLGGAQLHGGDCAPNTEVAE